jgi:hypothetical protein
MIRAIMGIALIVDDVKALAHPILVTCGGAERVATDARYRARPMHVMPLRAKAL